jgi:hypothetical protein
MTGQPLVPLALVAAQLGQEAWQLAAHVRKHMVIDPENGLDSVPTAISRQLTNEHRAVKAAQAAQTERVRRELAQRQHSLHPGLRARAVRQRALLRNDPGLGAYAVMAPDSGGADRELDAAGRRHDDYVNAERRGVAGFGHRFTQKG